MRRKNKFYIAAPFFNPVQMQLVQDIENLFMQAHVDFFSPRLLSENEGGGPLTPAKAAAIFRKDVEGIVQCDSMLAVVDWQLPEDQQIRALSSVEVDEGTQSLSAYYRSDPLNLPDSGTVFEMGAAYMRTVIAREWHDTEAFEPMRAVQEAIAKLPGGKERHQLVALLDMLGNLRLKVQPMRTAVYTERPATASLNLMLTQGAVGVINGLGELRAFLETTGEPNWDSLQQWQGGHR